MDNKTVSRAEFDKLLKKVEKLESSSTKKKTDTVPRKPSEYNNFISKEITKIKTENSGIAHQEAFKKAIEVWNNQKKSKEDKEVVE